MNLNNFRMDSSNFSVESAKPVGFCLNLVVRYFDDFFELTYERNDDGDLSPYPLGEWVTNRWNDDGRGRLIEAVSVKEELDEDYYYYILADIDRLTLPYRLPLQDRIESEVTK